MSRNFYHKHFSAAVLLVILHSVIYGTTGITVNSKNDPDPIFTSLDPHYFLDQFEKDMLKKVKSIKEHPERFYFSISPFFQGALCAKPSFIKSCKDCFDLNNNDEAFTFDSNIEIGDLGGRWNMIALLFGPTPPGCTLQPVLAQARALLFPTVPPGTPIEDPLAIDPCKNFGFFSVPVEYRKWGVRFETGALITCDIGFTLKAGIANICQVGKFLNRTCLATITSTCSSSTSTGITTVPVTATTQVTSSPLTCPSASGSIGSNPFDPTNPNLTAVNVNQALMYRLQDIVREACQSIEQFNVISAEDIRVGLFWRHAYPMNMHRKGPCFEEFLLIPFFQVEGSIPVGHERARNHAFALSFGSEDHPSLGFNTGINFDFTQTIEFGAEAGITHFFARCFNKVPMPTSNCQSGIYPFTTDARIQPGNNAHFGATMSAYHFIGCLSFYFQYRFIRHLPDCIILNQPNPDCVFKPHLLEQRSNWISQMANMGFNYDITPYISLGFVWQAPIGQRNAYKSSTALISFNVTY
jgi:hypothetical protein